MSCEDTWPSRSATSSSTARGPTTVTRSLWPIVSVPAGTMVGFAAWACLSRETPICSVVGRGEHRHGHRLVHLDAHRDVADLLAARLRAGPAQRPGRDGEHDDDAAEVGDRVADGRGRGVGRAGGCRRERRGVGERAGVGAGHGAGLEARARARAATATAPTRASAPATTSIVGQPRPQRGEEVGAGDHADGVGEQDEPEDAEDLGDLELDAGGRGPRRDAQRREEHGGRPEAHPGDPHVADRRAEGQQHREEEQGVLGEGLEQRGHVLDTSTVGRRRMTALSPPTPRRARHGRLPFRP